LLTGCFTSATPPDAQLLERFRNHRSEFARVVEMLKEDEKLRHLRASSITPKDAIDGKRHYYYRNLLFQIGVDVVHQWPGGVRVIFAPDALTPLGREKGYVYSEKTLEPLRESLDLKDREVTPYAKYYRHIEGYWYLYYDNPSDF